MIFFFVRLLIGCLFFAGTVILIKKLKPIRKRMWYTASAVISIVLISALALLPIENLFITFDSPEDAYQYTNAGKSNIQLVVEGQGCDLVVDNRNGTYVHLIVPKTSDGWELGIGANTKMITHEFFDDLLIHVYQYKNTSDYFIAVLNTNGGTSEIVDSCNSLFYPLEKQDQTSGQTFTVYYAHIPKYGSDYWIKVNGSTITSDISQNEM